ncbi:MAG: hypothetical protein LBH15_01975 [Treponema sp.]|jgi:hypothetical protein|nr:hypothetical protein [Treponema sp.]
MKNSNTDSCGGIADAAGSGDRGFTLAETLPAIAVVTLLLSALLFLLSGTGINAARSKETLFFLRDFLEFDKLIREKAGEVIIPYWERTPDSLVFPAGDRGLPGAVLEIPYYGGAKEGILRLSIDGENRLSLESSGGEARERYRSPGSLLAGNIEVIRNGEGRPLALKFNFEYRNRSFYTLAPFAAFPVKRRF